MSDALLLSMQNSGKKCRALSSQESTREFRNSMSLKIALKLLNRWYGLFTCIRGRLIAPCLRTENSSSDVVS